MTHSGAPDGTRRSRPRCAACRALVRGLLSILAAVGTASPAAAAAGTSRLPEPSPHARGGAPATVAPVRTGPPHLEGSVRLDPDLGLLEGDVCTSGFAPRPDLRFLLSAALNVQRVADADGRVLAYRGFYGGRMVGEAREYVVQQPDSLPPLGTLCVSYRGAVPLYADNTAAVDWKGNIVAVRGALRAAEQSRWYPTLYDSTAATDVQAVTYRLRVACTACDAIYVNGAAPVADTAGTFASSTPRTLLLYAGRFPVKRAEHLWFVGGRAGPETVRVLDAAVQDIADYYAGLLGRPYGETPVFLTFLSASRSHRPGRPDWAFVTWPTIAYAGAIAFDSLLVTGAGRRVLAPNQWSLLSHEMAHYYFGTLRVPRGPLQWIVLESTAEYLALRAVARFQGRGAWARRIAGMLAQPAAYVTLDRITRGDEIDEVYRYVHAPLMLSAVAERAGEDRVARLLRALLDQDDATSVDFASFIAAAEASGIDRSELTAGATPAAVRATLWPAVHATLGALAADPGKDAATVELAVDVINADTTVDGRLGALDALLQLVARDPDNLGAHYQIGKAGALTGREPDAALASLRRYLASPVAPGAPGHGAAHWRIGMVEEARGRVDAARVAYRAALEADPGLAEARAALERLGR